MSALDEKVEHAADRLARLSRAAARAGGVRARLAEPLADDAELLRKLKPSLIAARARGEAPSDGVPADGRPVDEEPTESRPAVEPRPRSRAGADGGPSPLLVVAAAFALGMVLAHVLAWLGHRYPRD